MRELDLGDLQMVVRDARFAFKTDHAIIGGGAVRDLLLSQSGLHRRVKDIDVFVRLDGMPIAITSPADCAPVAGAFKEGCERFLGSLGMFIEGFEGTVQFRPVEETESGVNPFCFARIMTNEWPVPIEVIGIGGDPVDEIVDYDFNISQCILTPRSTLMTPACAAGHRNHVVEFMGGIRDEASLQRSKRRLARLRDKYSDFEFTNCQILDATPEIQK